ncbi:MAG: acetylglutamate kinase [Hellea sp.]|nr:acetylglutamate kinase [Hellea sp.]
MQRRRKNEDQWDSARVLSEALPFIQRYSNETIIIKFGGHAMGDPELTRQFANDVVLLRQFGLRPVIVHGGGPQIGQMLERLNIKSEFVDGLRVSDIETVEIAEMVLSGGINKVLVQAINKAGGKAVGISGRDANLITAKKLREDLGFAGKPAHTDVSVLNTLSENGFIPVISPISAGDDNTVYNVNADTAAGILSGDLGAARLILLTDVEGVLDSDKNLLTNLSTDDARDLIKNGTAQGGMIPKLETAINAVETGVRAVVIIDGRRAHGLLVELFTDKGAGTLIR